MLNDVNVAEASHFRLNSTVAWHLDGDQWQKRGLSATISGDQINIKRLVFDNNFIVSSFIRCNRLKGYVCIHDLDTLCTMGGKEMRIPGHMAPATQACLLI